MTNNQQIRKFFSHRSGTETRTMCRRNAFLEYHYLGRGISKAPTPMHFDVGNAVHHGLHCLLETDNLDLSVATSLNFFNQSDQIVFRQDEVQEQLWSIECMMRAFGVGFWPAFKKNYEILYVEIEIDETYQVRPEAWIHAKESGSSKEIMVEPIENYAFDLVFSSRPDAIVRDRRTKEVIGISWKTIDDLTDYRRSRFHYDLQGFTETYFPSLFFADQHKAIIEQLELLTKSSFKGHLRKAMEKALSQELEKMPTQVDSIQTIFFEKGKRGYVTPDEDSPFETDDAGSGSYMVDSFITRPWRDRSTGNYSHAYRYKKPENKTKSQLGKGWERVKAFDLSSVPVRFDPKDWINMLNERKIFPSSEFITIANPLNDIVIYDEPAPRDPQFVNDVMDGVIAGEIQKAKDLIQIEQVETVQEKLYLLNVLFPHNFRSCVLDYKCSMFDICHGKDRATVLDWKTLPVGFKERKPHHDAETKEEDGK